MTEANVPPLPPQQPGGVEVYFSPKGADTWCAVTLSVLPRVGDYVEFTLLEDDSEKLYVVESVTWFLDLPNEMDPDVADSGKVTQIITRLKEA